MAICSKSSWVKNTQMDKICRTKSSGDLSQEENKIGNNLWLSSLQYSIALKSLVGQIRASVLILLEQLKLLLFSLEDLVKTVFTWEVFNYLVDFFDTYGWDAEELFLLKFDVFCVFLLIVCFEEASHNSSKLFLRKWLPFNPFKP